MLVLRELHYLVTRRADSSSCTASIDRGAEDCQWSNLHAADVRGNLGGDPNVDVLDNTGDGDVASENVNRPDLHVDQAISHNYLRRSRWYGAEQRRSQQQRRDECSNACRHAFVLHTP